MGRAGESKEDGTVGTGKQVYCWIMTIIESKVVGTEGSLEQLLLKARFEEEKLKDLKE